MELCSIPPCDRACTFQTHPQILALDCTGRFGETFRNKRVLNGLPTFVLAGASHFARTLHGLHSTMSIAICFFHVTMTINDEAQ